MPHSGRQAPLKLCSVTGLRERSVWRAYLPSRRWPAWLSKELSSIVCDQMSHLMYQDGSPEGCLTPRSAMQP